jgi:hypothetical protein
MLALLDMRLLYFLNRTLNVTRFHYLSLNYMMLKFHELNYTNRLMGVLILENLNDFLFSVFQCEGAPSVSLNVKCSMCLLRCQECKVSIRGASTL